MLAHMLASRLTWSLVVVGLLLRWLPALAQASDARQVPATQREGVLRPGDLVRLKVWHEQDLSGDFRVDDQGAVVFPKIGALPVTNQSPQSIREAVVSRYSVYLRNPSIDVTVLRRVNVGGAVRNPGLYDVDPTMSVADAVALAGGIANDGKHDRIEVVRGDDKMTLELTREMAIAETPLRSGDQLIVPQQSWLSRNHWLAAVVVSAAIGAVVHEAIRR